QPLSADVCDRAPRRLDERGAQSDALRHKLIVSHAFSLNGRRSIVITAAPKRHRKGARVEIFETLSQLGYGELHFGRDEASGLRAIVAIHSTRLGPAIGGS